MIGCGKILFFEPLIVRLFCQFIFPNPKGVHLSIPFWTIGFRKFRWQVLLHVEFSPRDCDHINGTFQNHLIVICKLFRFCEFEGWSYYKQEAEYSHDSAT